MFLFFYAIRKFSNLEKNKTFLFFFIQRLVHIYLSFFPVSDSLKEAYKNEETEALSRSEIPRFYILLVHLCFSFPSSSSSACSSVFLFLFICSVRRQAMDDSRETYA